MSAISEKWSLIYQIVSAIFFVTDCKELKRAQTTVEPRLSGLVGTRLSSPDNRKYEY